MPDTRHMLQKAQNVGTKNKFLFEYNFVEYIFCLCFEVLDSISSKFYVHVFSKKIYPKLQSCVLGLKFIGAKILAKKHVLSVYEIDS